jgi:hypothetical protein
MTEPGAGVRLVQVVVAPSHSQTAVLLLLAATPKSSSLPRPESVTICGGDWPFKFK